MKKTKQEIAAELAYAIKEIAVQRLMDALTIKRCRRCSGEGVVVGGVKWGSFRCDVCKGAGVVIVKDEHWRALVEQFTGGV